MECSPGKDTRSFPGLHFSFFCDAFKNSVIALFRVRAGVLEMEEWKNLLINYSIPW